MTAAKAQPPAMRHPIAHPQRDTSQPCRAGSGLSARRNAAAGASVNGADLWPVDGNRGGPGRHQGRRSRAPRPPRDQWPGRHFRAAGWFFAKPAGQTDTAGVHGPSSAP